MKKIVTAIILSLVCLQAFGQLVITQRKEEPLEKQRSSSVVFLDFRPYTLNGFFLSTGDCPTRYTPICSMEITVDPETLKNTERKKASEPLYFVNEIKGQELLAEAVEFAKQMGSNGIADLAIATVDYGSGGDIAVSPNIRRYVITGLCILIPADD